MNGHPRVAVVTSHPIQYQAPWFRALARVVDLDVFFCHQQDARGQACAGYGVPFEWDVPLLDGYRHHWLRNVASEPGVSSYRGCDTPDIGEALARGAFDACIVSGWYLKSYVQAIRACWSRRIRVFVRGDSQLATRRSRVKAGLKWLPYRVLLNRIDGHLYVGAANKAYLAHYGVPDRKLFFVPHFVDNDFFADRSEAARADGTARAVRDRHGIPRSAAIALFVGRLVGQKRVADMIEALAALNAANHEPVHALIVGSGAEMAPLQRLAAARHVPVHFAGFRNQTELPAYYAAADLLVLPSDGRETWGLVVNEAMACGLPAIVSDAAGCASDLVVPGETGYRYPLGDVAALADALGRLRADVAEKLEATAAAVRSRIANYSCAAAVQGTLAALSGVGAGSSGREQNVVSWR